MKNEKADNVKSDTNDNAEMCSKGCHLYSKTMEEVLQATAKHRDAALALKDISNQQKKKIAWYREQLIQMQSQIDQLENDNDTEKENVAKLLNEKKIMEDKIDGSNEEAKKMVILNDKLEVEIERLNMGSRVSWFCQKVD